MWRFYLICSKNYFRYAHGMVFQIQLARSRQDVPQTRDYITENATIYLRRLSHVPVYAKEKPFYERKCLHEMSPVEWESLCDGCGKCCVLKLEDVDTNIIYSTDVGVNCWIVTMRAAATMPNAKNMYLIVWF